MDIVCSDLEGIFTPEIWINVAEKTGIADLRLTTRDIADYDVLMRKRLSILNQNGLKLKDITDVIAGMEPLGGALDFLNWLRAKVPVIIVSDTYEEFVKPLMRKLGWPTLFCHHLTIGRDGAIADYNLRQKDGKYKVVEALKGLNYRVCAIGDSYNDIAMLKAAHSGFLFRPPENVRAEFAQFSVSENYDELRQKLRAVLGDGTP
jgi:phosphoserine/homoserine phosphotransferase